MKKKFKLTLLVGGLALACIGAGCGNLNAVEKNQEKGYKISVSYDANGGSFLNRPGVGVMDMFNPSNYEKDSNGTVHIKLTEPTDPSRPTSASESITLTMQNHFFAGWYQNREVKTVDGVPVDEKGNALTLLEDGTYVYSNTVDLEVPTKATPAYNYSGYWDFEKDRLQYTEGVDDTLSLTLYAGWVPYYEFNYYYQVEGEWKKLDTVTTFDYKAANSIESEADKDTVYLPSWKDGAMNYKHEYANSSSYTFPSIEGTTFEKAYTDAACTEEIVEKLEHKGSLTVASGENKALVVENPVQNVYVVVSEGEQYRIEKAQQLVDYANAAGYYEIAGDLDFTDLTWPTVFSTGEFTGKMYGKDGAAITFSNLSVKYSSDSKHGGLFGKIAKSAKIENITFANVMLDIVYTGSRNHEASYGLFAGIVEEGATLSVTIDGTMKIGAIGYANDLAFHTIANGDRTGITAGSVGLTIYGSKLLDQYEYTVNPETVTVAEDGTIVLAFYPSSHLLPEENYIIQ